MLNDANATNQYKLFHVASEFIMAPQGLDVN